MNCTQPGGLYVLFFIVSIYAYKADVGRVCRPLNGLFYSSGAMPPSNPHSSSSSCSDQGDPVPFHLSWVEPQLQAPGPVSHTGCKHME